ncbi:MAG: hypothetical protein RL375_3497 [Pseudomonadota bacterium]|jgi:hypothetical protein
MSQQQASSTQTIDDLRRVLFDTINAVKGGQMDITKASVINDLSRTLVDTAKVEVDFLRVTDSDQSAFIAPARPALPPPAEPEHNNGIVSITRHAIGR